MPALEDQVFTFGEFTLAPKERLFLRGQQPVPLTPKAFDILVVLVRRSGHLVTKDDLLREVRQIRGGSEPHRPYLRLAEGPRSRSQRRLDD